ncbi:unnamed protein product [Bursaphelenchus okinawaensis]|uniref:Uncharacterized protein n=1 Tax=Bursaphelenchus okinawaensis TaxID=465554 RepID=A0A811JW16_9BILA|nr:unnamed protein product [Bursaphelenchus okinawaensis]CAG9085683.1 unnamed protein product [Bursaphelenchus okinawaensis]
MICCTVMPESTSKSPLAQKKHQALHSIKKTLEGYSDEAIRRMLGPEAIPLNEEVENKEVKVDVDTTTTSTTSAPPENEETNSLRGVFRVRADITSSSSALDEDVASPRHHRHARYSDWSSFGHHHRRRRKGCPPMHGKDQLLCPSRNSHRYDVCISREQLCDHIVDCPDGEDEDPKQCFFYKPLDDQLKTLSHAVLLLVDNVMANGNLGRNEL